MSDMGLSIAGSGIAADTALLDTASNNLSNISTPGYAAEQVNLSPEAAAGPFGAGQGVVVGSVSRLSDAVYSAANVAAVGVNGAATQTNQIMNSLEAIFPEPNNNGLASQLSSLWSDLSTLASNPNQSGAQQAVVSDAQSVASTLRDSFSQVTQQASLLQSQIGSGSNDGGSLAQVNNLLSQIAKTNAAIVGGTVAGQDVNALMDQNAAAVDKLAGLMGVSSTTSSNGSVSVYMSGIQLVSGNTAQTLVTTGSASTQNLNIFTKNGAPVGPGGSIGANLTAINSTIPSYENQLNQIADSLATKMNTLQANGMDSAGEPGSAIQGTWPSALPNIFVNNGSSSAYTTSSSGYNSASSIEVSSALTSNTGLIATAAAPSSSNSNVIGQPTLDGTNAQAMAALASSTTGPNALYQVMIGDLGTQAANASATAKTASNLATTASNNLASISGVDMNKEELNILTAQNAFQASSKVINAINSSFQSLIQAV